MPPPKRGALPPKPADTFVNRDRPLRVFEDAAFGIPRDRSVVTVFLGPGGQGKTALCRKLTRVTNADPAYEFLRSAELDLHGRPKTDPDLLLVWIRNAFARVGVGFATFDIALAVTWEATRGEQPFPKLVNAWLAKSADMLPEAAPEAVQTLRETLEKSVETIPGLGVLVTKGSKWVIDKTKRAYLERTRESLAALYRDGQLKKPYELSELLPWMLAQDLNHHLAHNRNERFVLLIDEYERVFEEGGAGARWRENHFDRHMRTLLQESDGLLAVFFSREKLPWSEDPAWHRDLENSQHMLGGLAARDADEWLRRIPIADEKVRAAIIDSAREKPSNEAHVYPLLVDLQVEHWRSLVADGSAIHVDQFHLAARSFEGRCREVVERIMRDYGDELQVTLERLSVASRFDRAAFEHVIKTLGTGLPFAAFDRLAGLSFIAEGEDGFLTMHRSIADAICATLDSTTYQAAARALLEHYEARAAVKSSRNLTEDSVSALMEAAYLRQKIGTEGYADWLVNLASPLLQAARYEASELVWRKALAATEDALGPDHPDTATIHNSIALSLAGRGRYEEAEPLLRLALEIRERKLGQENISTAESYNNLALNLKAQGRYVSAEPLFRKGLGIHQRLLGNEHPDTATCYNNLAGALNALGLHEEAEPLYRWALMVMERILGEDHQLTATIHNNTASNLDDLGDHLAAEPHYRTALKIRQRVLGEEHPDTATSYNNVAYNLELLGRPDEAEPLFRKALEAAVSTLGEEHPLTKLFHSNLRACLKKANRGSP